jgi:kynurenine formamidase
MCGVDPTHLPDLIAALNAERHKATRSPFGPDDEIGMLNLMTPESRRAITAEADFGAPFDLSVDFFPGMPSWTAAGDPAFQIWMSHTPEGTVADDPMGHGRAINELVGYSGDCVMFYTHTGTHIDTLNHYAYHGEMWNGFRASEHLGSRHWNVAGADKVPPVVARGVLLDVAAAQGVAVLPSGFGIGERELREALRRQGTELRTGDVVIVRTGRMSLWPDPELFMPDEPGLNREGAEFLARSGAMIVGADNLALEQMPTPDPDNWVPVHTYLLVEAGVPILELVDVEALAAERLYEFAFVGSCMPIRGATAAPMRPIALPLGRGR